MDDETLMQSLRQYLAKKCSAYRSDKLLPLMMPTFGPDEIMEAIDSMAAMQITMDAKVEAFQKDFAAYIGAKHAIMVNSGSSANLLALSVLSNPAINGRIMPGDEILVPAVTWSTTIFPIFNINARPVLVDVDQDYLIDIEKMKELIGPKTKAIMPVHLLGNVCDMGAIADLAEDHGLFVVEDTCEALGSEYKGAKAGTFSDFSTYSTYFSHHITTGEGGMLCTSNPEYADLALIMRAHGYIRHSIHKAEYAAQNPSIDHRFLFMNTGFNMRPMEIQGAFGIHQLKKIEQFIGRRIDAGRKLLSHLKRYEGALILPREKPDTRHSWFAFPMTIRDGAGFSREELAVHLEKNGIATRPLVCGNLAEQPAMKLFDYGKGDLSNAHYIMRHSLYIGIHPNIDDETLEQVCAVFDAFFAGRKK
ncbi:DegT/DnrJ/EryC1/StrS family aminotransferase [Candidatus Micrarchaeota archaeon]|nr:DegT/DnrJ/EryC1/StrS family aminotransferase [Candidatus Micrarchaeota archaeon]